jgi:hypothetical protein
LHQLQELVSLKSCTLVPPWIRKEKLNKLSNSKELQKSKWLQETHTKVDTILNQPLLLNTRVILNFKQLSKILNQLLSFRL